MSLGYSGRGLDSFLDTMSKQIIQVETKTFLVWDEVDSRSGTKQFLQVHSWSVNHVDLGQVDQDDDV